jgi:hypothetical protein
MTDLTDFIEHRKDIKKPMSERAVMMLERKIARAVSQGHDADLLIENAIIGGWQTVYPNESTLKKRLGFIEKHTDTSWSDGIDNVKRIK